MVDSGWTNTGIWKNFWVSPDGTIEVEERNIANIDMDIDDLVTYLKVNAPTDDRRDIYLQAADIIQSAKEWYDMSNPQMRLHCGEMTTQEIRNIKAVLGNILKGHPNKTL